MRTFFQGQFDYLFASEHDIRGSFEAVNDGLATGVQVIKSRLDDGIVDIHGRRQQLSGLGHLVQPVYPGDGLLHNPLEGVHLEVNAMGKKKSKDKVFLNSVSMSTTLIVSPSLSKLQAFGGRKIHPKAW